MCFSIVALSAQLPFAKNVFIDQSVIVTSLAILFVLVLLAIFSRFSFVGSRNMSAFGNLIPSFVMFGTTFYRSASRNLGGLSFLGKSEDNTAWLMGLSFGLNSEIGIKNVADLGWAGGPALGMFNALTMSI